MRSTNNEISEVAGKQGKRSSVQNWSLLILGWLPPVVGVSGWVAGLFYGEDLSCAWIFFVFGLLASVAISVVLHEFAHFYAARFLGLAPWCMSFGHGDVVFDKQLPGLRLVLRVNPYAGAVYPFLLAHQEHANRWKRFIMVLAGPLANALLLGISALRADCFRNAGYSLGVLSQSAIPVEMLLANAYLLLASLIPFRPRINGLHTPSDGMQLVLLLLGRPVRVSRSRDSDSSTATETTTTKSSSPGWNWLVKRVQPEALLEGYRRQLDNPKLSIGDRCLLLDGFATCVLMYGANTFLSEADQYSEELIRHKPTEWTVKGTRGSILVEKGDIEAGIAMLTEVVEHDSSAFDRAIAASFLALAEWKRSNHEAALKWLRRSLEFDPKCAAARRIGLVLNARDLKSLAQCQRPPTKPEVVDS